MSSASPARPTSWARPRLHRTTIIATSCLLVAGTLVSIRPARGGPEPACGWSMASVSNDGRASRSVTGDWPAIGGSVSSNGRYVVFSTDARLTGNDDDRESDVFLRDLDTSRTRLVGRGVKGRALRGDAWGGQITSDGRYLLFSTGAVNAHPDANGHTQIYRRDLSSGRVDLISRGTGGVPGNISTDGGAITPDGRYVVFTSQATNMLGGSGDRNDSNSHAFVRDVKRGRTIPVSVTSSGSFVSGVATSISRDGRFVAFIYGPMGGTAEAYVRDLVKDRTIRVSRNYDGSPTGSSAHARDAIITPNGRYVMFTSASDRLVRGDTNGVEDVFVLDRRTKRTQRASVGTGGKQANRASLGLSVSNDGSVVTFTTKARNLDKRVGDFHPFRRNNGYAHDLDSGRTRLFTICDDGTETNGYHNPDPLLISGNKETILASVQASNWAPESSQGPQFRYQIYHRDFDIRPPTVLTTGGPYSTDPGTAVDLSAIARKPNGDPRGGITIRFVVSKRNGDVVWSEETTTDGAGSAAVTHVPSLDVRRYVVTAIVPATPTHARAETIDELAVGL